MLRFFILGNDDCVGFPFIAADAETADHRRIQSPPICDKICDYLQ